MAALCVDDIYPEFDIMTQFLINDIICAQKLDALQNRLGKCTNSGHYKKRLFFRAV